MRSARWLPLVMGLALGAQAQDESPPPAPAPEPAIERAEVIDSDLLELRARLDGLIAGTLPEDVDAESLFSVPLDDAAQVNDRLEALKQQLSAGREQLGELEARLRELDLQERQDATAAPEAPEPGGEPVAEAPTPPVEPDSSGVPNPSEVDPATEAEREAAEAAAVAEAARRTAAREAERAREERLRLEEERRARSQLRETQRVDLRADLAPLRLRNDVAERRVQVLSAVAKRLDRLSDAAKRILPNLDKPREGLRRHAEALAALAEGVGRLGQRVDRVSHRSQGGMVVGFVSEQRALGESLATEAAAFESQAKRLSRQSGELLALADSIESEGRRVRRLMFRGVARGAAQSELDALFLDHLRAGRLLRLRLRKSARAPGLDEIEALRAASDAIAARPRQIATTGDARSALDASVLFHKRILELLEAEEASESAWELAFENELVSVLSEQASKKARADAYTLSSELLDDVRGELGIAWDRLRQGFEARRASIPSLRVLLTEPAGRVYLKGAGAMLAALGFWLALRRGTPRITVSLVKSLARMPSFRGRVGLLVRWSGLLQALLPALLAWVALRGLVAYFGETPLGQVLWAVGLPLTLYAIGRQALIGATRRITAGRPALIGLRPETLARLRRTYATLGLVITVAYILDGLARVVIGAGRFVALVDAAMLAWVVVWAVFETIRWRKPLADAWSRQFEESETPGFEARAAAWMQRSRLGFVLSVPAFLRIVLTPIVNFVSNVATDTSFVQSIRTRLLRRRSRQVKAPSTSSDALPPEYLEAFPLHPILGEDDSLLVLREGLLEDIGAQFSSWRETRGDGSLALIGEKGIGKTTLAAQIRHRVKGVEIVHHTIRGKPTTREELVRDLREPLGCASAASLEELEESLCEGPERAILLDEAHNVFLRRVDGYGAYDALVDLVNATSSKVFWVVVFNRFTWRFLDESRGRMHFFRKRMHVPAWRPEEIQRLILLRNKRAGFELHFDELLLSEERSRSGNLELVEESEGYFRLLWESSSGNPRIATRLWLSSLSLIGERELAVGLFREPNTELLSELQDDVLFCLAAICQHENLSAEELARVLNLPEGFARFSLQYLLEAGLLVKKDESGERFTLSATHYRATLRMLRSRHLLFD